YHLCPVRRAGDRTRPSCGPCRRQRRLCPAVRRHAGGKRMIIVARLAFFTILAYAVMLTVLYVTQRYLMYYPVKPLTATPAESGVPEMTRVSTRTEDGLDLFAWFAPPREDSGRIIVFFHGNAGHIAHRSVKARVFLDAGYGVMLCEYRGYGGNP